MPDAGVAFVEAVDTCRSVLVAACREALEQSDVDRYALAMRVLAETDIEILGFDIEPPQSSAGKEVARVAELASAASLNLLAISKAGLKTGRTDDEALEIQASYVRRTGLSFGRLRALSQEHALGFYMVEQVAPRHFHLKPNLQYFGSEDRWNRAIERANKSRFVEAYRSVRLTEEAKDTSRVSPHVVL